mgnify:CR=1 FL=1
MALVLNEDEVMMRDMAQGYFAEKAPVKALRTLRDTKDETGFDRGLWADMAAQGFAGIAQMLKDEGYKGTSARIAPNFMLRLMAMFDREAKGMLGFLDVNIHADNSQTRTVFNWTPRSLRESALDSARAVKAISS